MFDQRENTHTHTHDVHTLRGKTHSQLQNTHTHTHRVTHTQSDTTNTHTHTQSVTTNTHAPSGRVQSANRRWWPGWAAA